MTAKPNANAPANPERVDSQPALGVVSSTCRVGSVSVSDHVGNGTWLIAFEGEHDLATVPLVEAKTREVWSRCAHAVVDFADATFIDSSVIKWLESARSELGAVEGQAISIVEGPPGSIVTRVIDLLGLREIFPCHRSREDAIAALPIPSGQPRRA